MKFHYRVCDYYVDGHNYDRRGAKVDATTIRQMLKNNANVVLNRRRKTIDIYYHSWWPEFRPGLEVVSD